MKAASNMPGNHKIEGTRGVGIGEYRKDGTDCERKCPIVGKQNELKLISTKMICMHF